jgi:hypothetical protein
MLSNPARPEVEPLDEARKGFVCIESLEDPFNEDEEEPTVEDPILTHVKDTEETPSRRLTPNQMLQLIYAISQYK